jgi:carboxypeptidase family protein
MRKILVAVLMMALLCLSASTLFAQATASASLQGTVLDKSGAVVPNADVTVTNKDTGLTRTTTTGGTGNYRFDLLPAGIYEVRVAAKGFGTAVYANVELAVSRTTTIDASISPSQQAEVVTVEASGAALVDLQKTDVSRAVNTAEVIELPSNSRDFVGLAILAPGARPVNSYDPTKNRVGVFATNGSNGRNVNVTVNGIDNKDNTVGGPVMQLPLEAIEEFNISTQRFSAANGRSEGAAVNVITKSGTNNFHGSLFYQDRRDVFQANDFFSEQGGQSKPPFLRQQFGGSIGGPVKKDKTFLFFALEREREETSFPVTNKAFTELSLVTNFGAQPARVIPTPYFDWRYNGKLDHRFNEKNNLSVSYTNQNNRGLNDQSTSTNDLSAGNFTTNQLIIANVTLTSVLSPNVVNVGTVGYQYWNNLIDSNLRVPNFTFPNETFGTNGNVPQQSFQKKWQFKDDLSITKGKHTFRTGFDYLYEPVLGGFFIFNPTITFSFFDDPSTILGNKVAYPQGFATPGAVSGISDTSGNPYFFLAPKMFGAYFQDDWKVSRRLSLNLGLRWDRDYDLNGGAEEAKARVFQRLAAIHNPYGGGLPHDDTKDFSPRIGIAYDLTGTGKHVLRAGYGLYFGQTFINIPLFMLQQTNQFLFTQKSFNSSATPGTACNASVSDTLPSGQLLCAFRLGVDPNPPKPAPATDIGPSDVSRPIDPKYRNPYTQQWNAGYSWAVTGNSVIEVEYVHVLGLHDAKTIVINPKDVNNGGVRNTDAPLKAAGLPLLGQVRMNEPIGRNRYDAMNIAYRKRMSNHFSINTNYVLSRALGYNGASASFGNAPTDLNNIFAAHDLGPVPGVDEKHRWVVSGIADLPWGIKFAPIMQWASARPLTPLEGQNDTFGFGGGQGSTHTIVLNSDPNNLLGTKSFSAAQLRSCLAGGTCQEVATGFLRGQIFYQLDARFSKEFKMGDRMKLDVFFQAFDLTNRANFGSNFGTNIRTSTFEQPTGFVQSSGVIVPHSFNGEFGARFSF